MQHKNQSSTGKSGYPKKIALFLVILATTITQVQASGDRIRDTAMGVVAGTLAAQGINAAVRVMSQPSYSQQYAAPAYYQPSGYAQSGYYNQPQPAYYQQQPMYLPQQPVYQQPMYQPQPRTQVIEHIVYDERPRESKNWWYYCRPSKTYYPYVKSCRTEWEKVPAAPQE